MEAGLAIVALAIALDRLSQAIAHKQASGHVHQASEPGFWRRYPNLTLAVAILAVTTLLGLFVPAFAQGAEGDHLHHRAAVEGGGRTG